MNIHIIFVRDTIMVKDILYRTTSSRKINNPFFFSATVNCNCYMTMLCHNFMPQLIATSLQSNSLSFVQYQAMSLADVFLYFLHGYFGPQVISHHFSITMVMDRSAHPTDHTLVCEYFLWDFMKEATRQNGNHTEHALHQEQLFIFL